MHHNEPFQCKKNRKFHGEGHTPFLDTTAPNAAFSCSIGYPHFKLWIRQVYSMTHNRYLSQMFTLNNKRWFGFHGGIQGGGSKGAGFNPLLLNNWL